MFRKIFLSVLLEMRHEEVLVIVQKRKLQSTLTPGGWSLKATKLYKFSREMIVFYFFRRSVMVRTGNFKGKFKIAPHFVCQKGIKRLRYHRTCHTYSIIIKDICPSPSLYLILALTLDLYSEISSKRKIIIFFDS